LADGLMMMSLLADIESLSCFLQLVSLLIWEFGQNTHPKFIFMWASLQVRNGVVWETARAWYFLPVRGRLEGSSAGFSKTPDVKLDAPIGVRGRMVNWIDSKAWAYP
jgi:hypothetical protein